MGTVLNEFPQLWRPLVGAIVFLVLEETLPIFLGAIAPTYAENWMILFGPFLIAVVLLGRGGLVGLMSYFVSRINTVTNKEKFNG